MVWDRSSLRAMVGHRADGGDSDRAWAVRVRPSKCCLVHLLPLRSILAFSMLFCLPGRCTSLLLWALASWWVWPVGKTEGSPRAGRGKKSGYFSPILCVGQHPGSGWVSSMASVSSHTLCLRLSPGGPGFWAILLPVCPFAPLSSPREALSSGGCWPST